MSLTFFCASVWTRFDSSFCVSVQNGNLVLRFTLTPPPTLHVGGDAMCVKNVIYSVYGGV